MKKIFSYLQGLLLIFVLGLSAHAELTKLVVNTTNANVRLRPNSQAIVISWVPLGGILISEGKIGNWFKVSLPADETGLILKGYINQSVVEVLGQAVAPVSGESSVAATKYRLRLVSANASIRLKPDLRSPSIFTIPLGATVLSEEKRGDWYKINSLPDSDGVVISGFVKSEDVELLEEIKPQVEPLANAEPEGQARPAESKLAKPAATAYIGGKKFSKGSFYLTPQLGINTWAVPFGLNAEYAITLNIGVGGTVMSWFWGNIWYSYSIIYPSLEGAYHFTKLNMDKLDLYAGAGLGFAIFSYSTKVAGFSGTLGSSGLVLGIILGARYYFTPNIAASLRINGSFLSGWGGFGGTIGVTFRLK